MSIWPDALEGKEPYMEGIYHPHDTEDPFRLPTDWPDLRFAGEDFWYVVKVAAVGLTTGEFFWKEKKEHEEPILGYDFSGWVVSGPKNAKCPPGTQVYGVTSFKRPGNARHYTATTLWEAVERPRNLSFEQCATVPMSVLTAFHALFNAKGSYLGGLLTMPPTIYGFHPDYPKPIDNGAKRILVLGGAGAVGGMVVQLAKLAGAGLVAATCSAKDMDFVKDLGAYSVFDYKNLKELEKWKRHFHGVIDCVGGEQLRQAFKYVRPHGYLLSVVNQPKDYLPEDQDEIAMGVCYAFFIVKPQPERLESMTRLLATGHLRPIFSPENVLNFDQWEEIPNKMKNKSRGKVVLTIDKGEPWEMIEIMQKYGEVPEVHPQPTAIRARGESTLDILKIYHGNRQLQKSIRRALKGTKKTRRQRIKALQAAQSAQASQGGKAAEEAIQKADRLKQEADIQKLRQEEERRLEGEVIEEMARMMMMDMPQASIEDVGMHLAVGASEVAIDKARRMMADHGVERPESIQESDLLKASEEARRLKAKQKAANLEAIQEEAAKLKAMQEEDFDMAFLDEMSAEEYTEHMNEEDDGDITDEHMDDLKKRLDNLIRRTDEVKRLLAQKTRSVSPPQQAPAPTEETPPPSIEERPLATENTPLLPLPPARTPLPTSRTPPPQEKTPLPSGVTTRTEEQTTEDYAKADVEFDMHAILERSRQRISALPCREPQKRRYGVLTEDVIAFTLSKTEDGGWAYTKRPKRPKRAETPMYDSEDERNLRKLQEYNENPSPKAVGSSPPTRSVQGLQSPWEDNRKVKGPLTADDVAKYTETHQSPGDMTADALEIDPADIDPEELIHFYAENPEPDYLFGSPPSAREVDAIQGLFGLGISSPAPSVVDDPMDVDNKEMAEDARAVSGQDTDTMEIDDIGGGDQEKEKDTSMDQTEVCDDNNKPDSRKETDAAELLVGLKTPKTRAVLLGVGGGAKRELLGQLIGGSGEAGFVNKVAGKDGSVTSHKTSGEEDDAYDDID